MMAGMCPMKVADTTAVASEVEGGLGLSFTSTTGNACAPWPRCTNSLAK
jgi:hypothetical protein